MSYRIAVCDDELVYTDMIGDHIELLDRMQSLKLSVFRFTDPQEMLSVHLQQPFDAIFLDIDMPQLTGFDVAAEIRLRQEHTRIIFVTSKHDLVYESFEYAPFYFLCKATDEKLRRDISHVLRKLLVNNRQNLLLKVSDSSFGEQMIPVRDVRYLKSDKHYRLYHTVNQTIPYKERGTIADKEIEFFAYHFIKPHRRYLVNTMHIKRFNGFDNEILLDNGEVIPVSKNMKDDAFRMYMEQKRN